jgi:YVTN family beta-propeller protein
MKLRRIELIVFLGVLFFIVGCDWSACTPTSPEWLTCDFNGLHTDVLGDTLLDYELGLLGLPYEVRNLAVGFFCDPSDNGYGGPLPSPSTMQTIPPSAPLSSGAPPANTRPRGTASPANPAGAYLPVPYLNLPFGPLASSSAPSPSASCDPSQPDILVVSHGSGTLTRLGTCPLTSKATIQLVSRPLEVQVTPDGSQALVTNFDNAVSFVDLATNTVTNLNTGSSINPSGIAISPDGKLAYVTSFNATNPAVVVIHIASRRITSTIPLQTQWPHSISITPDGGQLYVAYPFNNQVDIIDTLTQTQAVSLAIGAPYGIDFSPTGTLAYIASANSNPGAVIALDTASLQITHSYPVGTLPVDVRVVYGGQQVLVTNYSSSSVSVINTVTGQVTTASSNPPGMPMGLAVVR